MSSFPHRIVAIGPRQHSAGPVAPWALSISESNSYDGWEKVRRPAERVSAQDIASYSRNAIEWRLSFGFRNFLSFRKIISVEFYRNETARRFYPRHVSSSHELPSQARQRQRKRCVAALYGGSSDT